MAPGIVWEQLKAGNVYANSLPAVIYTIIRGNLQGEVAGRLISCFLTSDNA